MTEVVDTALRETFESHRERFETQVKEAVPKLLAAAVEHRLQQTKKCIEDSLIDGMRKIELLTFLRKVK